MDMNHACGDCDNVSSKHASITTVMITNLNCDNIVSVDLRQGRMSSKPHQGEVFMVNRNNVQTSSSLFSMYFLGNSGP
ncbi:hypothetical protein Peur_012545 [Populus x canadensis]